MQADCAARAVSMRGTSKVTGASRLVGAMRFKDIPISSDA
jgi:hypothetical protein